MIYIPGVSRHFVRNRWGPHPPLPQLPAYARVLLLRSATQEEFERDWIVSDAVVAKGYAPPRLVCVEALSVPVAWGLDKNCEEPEEYLEVLRVPDSRVEGTRYVQGIRIRGHGRTLESAMLRAQTFRELARRLGKEGIRRPIPLVDVAAFDLPYRMFRFDGHPRAICAKCLGLDQVLAYVFEVEP